MSWSLVFARSLLAAALCGAAAGGVYGSFIGPGAWLGVGTAWMAMGGGFVGAALGLVDGTLRATLALFAPGVRTSRVAATVTYGLAGAAFGYTGGLPSRLAIAGCAAVGAAIGAFVGPLTVHGVRPGIARRVCLCLSLACLLGGAITGALVGLGIGLVTYWPTFVIAMVEGAYLGAGCGIVLGVLMSLASLPFLRPDVP